MSIVIITSWYQSVNDLMSNPTNQQQLDQIEYDLERIKDLFFEEVAILEERMSKKQDNTDKTFAIGG